MILLSKLISKFLYFIYILSFNIMDSQNFYQQLLSTPSNNEINHSKSSKIYRNENRENYRYKDTTEFKEPSYSTFSILEETESKNTIYKNKKSNIITSLILSIRKDKEKEREEQEKKDSYKYINLTRFRRPSYKKYSYMDYPFYKIYNKEEKSNKNNKFNETKFDDKEYEL